MDRVTDDFIVAGTDNNTFKLLDLYFESIRFDQIRGVNGNVKLSINHKIVFAKASDFKSVKVTVTTTISTEDKKIDIEVKTAGVFAVDCFEKIDRKIGHVMVNIMYPYIRSQIQLITTQPGLMPVVLPVVTPDFKFNENDLMFN